MSDASFTDRLRWNLPWLFRYPFERAGSLFGRTAFEEKHLIFTIADHFEPAWSAGGMLPLDGQKKALDQYYRKARRTGEKLRDADGKMFGHTFFYPAEQYEPGLLETIAAMQREGLGEVEIHLHHGVDKPDTPENLKRQLLDFRDRLAADHKCLSRMDGKGEPRYAFVHGNLALANSAGGMYCGVDEEMQILADTGCYADMTLPSAPDRTQVSIINQIYECGGPLDQAVPHRTGRRLEADGREPVLPMIFAGPLVFNWSRRIGGIPVPRLDDGALVYNQPMDISRLKRWMGANITVRGRSNWIFVKLYCHSFFSHDQEAAIGEDALRFFGEIKDYGEKTGGFKLHFASAREAANMVFAAIDGKKGTPGEYRDYRLQTIMDNG